MEPVGAPLSVALNYLPASAHAESSTTTNNNNNNTNLANGSTLTMTTVPAMVTTTATGGTTTASVVSAGDGSSDAAAAAAIAFLNTHTPREVAATLSHMPVITVPAASAVVDGEESTAAEVVVVVGATEATRLGLDVAAAAPPGGEGSNTHGNHNGNDSDANSGATLRAESASANPNFLLPGWTNDATSGESGTVPAGGLAVATASTMMPAATMGGGEMNHCHHHHNNNSDDIFSSVPATPPEGTAEAPVVLANMSTMLEHPSAVPEGTVAVVVSAPTLAAMVREAAAAAGNSSVVSGGSTAANVACAAAAVAAAAAAEGTRRHAMSPSTTATTTTTTIVAVALPLPPKPRRTRGGAVTRQLRLEQESRVPSVPPAQSHRQQQQEEVPVLDSSPQGATQGQQAQQQQGKAPVTEEEDVVASTNGVKARGNRRRHNGDGEHECGGLRPHPKRKASRHRRPSFGRSLRSGHGNSVVVAPLTTSLVAAVARQTFKPSTHPARGGLGPVHRAHEQSNAVVPPWLPVVSHHVVAASSATSGSLLSPSSMSRAVAIQAHVPPPQEVGTSVAAVHPATATTTTATPAEAVRELPHSSSLPDKREASSLSDTLGDHTSSATPTFLVFHSGSAASLLAKGEPQVEQGTKSPLLLTPQQQQRSPLGAAPLLTSSLEEREGAGESASQHLPTHSAEKADSPAQVPLAANAAVAAGMIAPPLFSVAHSFEGSHHSSLLSEYPPVAARIRRKASLSPHLRSSGGVVHHWRGTALAASINEFTASITGSSLPAYSCPGAVATYHRESKPAHLASAIRNSSRSIDVDTGTGTTIMATTTTATSTTDEAALRLGTRSGVNPRPQRPHQCHHSDGNDNEWGNESGSSLAMRSYPRAFSSVASEDVVRMLAHGMLIGGGGFQAFHVNGAAASVNAIVSAISTSHSPAARARAAATGRKAEDSKEVNGSDNSDNGNDTQDPSGEGSPQLPSGGAVDLGQSGRPPQHPPPSPRIGAAHTPGMLWNSTSRNLRPSSPSFFHAFTRHHRHQHPFHHQQPYSIGSNPEALALWSAGGRKVSEGLDQSGSITAALWPRTESSPSFFAAVESGFSEEGDELQPAGHPSGLPRTPTPHSRGNHARCPSRAVSTSFDPHSPAAATSQNPALPYHPRASANTATATAAVAAAHDAGSLASSGALANGGSEQHRPSEAAAPVPGRPFATEASAHSPFTAPEALEEEEESDTVETESPSFGRSLDDSLPSQQSSSQSQVAPLRRDHTSYRLCTDGETANQHSGNQASTTRAGSRQQRHSLETPTSPPRHGQDTSSRAPVSSFLRSAAPVAQTSFLGMPLSTATPTVWAAATPSTPPAVTTGGVTSLAPIPVTRQPISLDSRTTAENSNAFGVGAFTTSIGALGTPTTLTPATARNGPCRLHRQQHQERRFAVPASRPFHSGEGSQSEAGSLTSSVPNIDFPPPPPPPALAGVVPDPFMHHLLPPPPSSGGGVGEGPEGSPNVSQRRSRDNKDGCSAVGHAPHHRGPQQWRSHTAKNSLLEMLYSHFSSSTSASTTPTVTTNSATIVSTTVGTESSGGLRGGDRGRWELFLSGNAAQSCRSIQRPASTSTTSSTSSTSLRMFDLGYSNSYALQPPEGTSDRRKGTAAAVPGDAIPVRRDSQRGSDVLTSSGGPTFLTAHRVPAFEPRVDVQALLDAAEERLRKASVEVIHIFGDCCQMYPGHLATSPRGESATRCRHRRDPQGKRRPHGISVTAAPTTSTTADTCTNSSAAPSERRETTTIGGEESITSFGRSSTKSAK